MTNFLKKNAVFPSLLLIFFAVSSLAQNKKEGDALDNKTFNITLSIDGSKSSKSEDDVLSFKNGKLSSKLMGKSDFNSGSYKITKDSLDADKDRVILFTSEMKTDAGDVLKWEGMITGESNIEGTSVWSKGSKTKKSYSFIGSLK